MGERKLQRGTFQHVEAELYAYPETRREIVRLRAEIMHPFEEEPDDKTVVKGANSARMPGDPTARQAILLVSDRRLRHMESVVDAIETVTSTLPPDHLKLVNLRYWSRPARLTWDGVAMEIGVSRRQAIRWRDRLVQNIAKKIGWH